MLCDACSTSMANASDRSVHRLMVMPRQSVHRNASERPHFRYFQISVNSTGSHKHLRRTQAMIDVTEIPCRLGSAARDEIAALARTYHIGHSRSRVDNVRGRVHRPRHFLIYRTTCPPSIAGQTMPRDLDREFESDRYCQSVPVFALLTRRDRVSVPGYP